MTALSTARRIREERWSYKQFPLAAVAVYQGGAAVIDTSTGYVTKGAASTTLKAIGTFAESVDNSAGSAGDKSVNVKLSHEVVTYRFVNGSAGNAIAATDIGKLCYFLDDQTVSIIAAAHSVAGIVWDVDTTKGVAVELLAPVAEPLTTGATLAFTAADCAIDAPGNRKHYKIPTSAANSTVSLGTTGAVRGDQITFTADGTANGHTVTYRDGSTAISAAATASKRHTAICTFDGTVWTCALSVGP